MHCAWIAEGDEKPTANYQDKETRPFNLLRFITCWPPRDRIRARKPCLRFCTLLDGSYVSLLAPSKADAENALDCDAMDVGVRTVLKVDGLAMKVVSPVVEAGLIERAEKARVALETSVGVATDPCANFEAVVTLRTVVNALSSSVR